MNRIQRCMAIVAGLGGTLLALTAAAPAALATIPDPGGGPAPGPQSAIPTVVTSGMPGWQITLIALGAALAAAVTAVILYRIWTARRHLAHPVT